MTLDIKIQLAILLIELTAGIMLGRIGIPLFRKIKTGRFEIYVGDRFKQDGSEPKLGGVVLLLTFMLGFTVGVSANGGYRLSEVMCVLIFIAALTAFGIYEDYRRETTSWLGFKGRHRLLVKLGLCIIFCLLTDKAGVKAEGLLLPFRLGYIYFGKLSALINGPIMALIITAAEDHNAHSGYTQTGIGGLCAVTVMIAMLGFGQAFIGRGTAQLICVCTAGCCGAYLVWGLSPAKLYLGQSGGLFLGAACAVLIIEADLTLGVLIGLIGILADGFCALLQRMIFSRFKKLLLKGASLREHLKAVTDNDYYVIGIFSVLQILGAVGAIAMAVYADKLLI